MNETEHVVLTGTADEVEAGLRALGKQGPLVDLSDPATRHCIVCDAKAGQPCRHVVAHHPYRQGERRADFHFYR